MKNVFIGLGLTVLIISLAFVFELGGLEWSKFFEPRKENIRREVFENTQSHVQGKLQDLSKYFLEYQNADSSGKETLKIVIQTQFSYFDADKIENRKLKQFLIKMRGF